MTEFLVKVADERDQLVEQVEHGYSESEVRERFCERVTSSIRLNRRDSFPAGSSNSGEGRSSRAGS